MNTYSNKFEKEQEVYNYVKQNAVDFLPLIITAINDGVQEENQRLREQKSNIEAGIIVLADKIKLEKIKSNMKDVLLTALESCTAFKMDTFIKRIKNNDLESK